MLKTYTGNEGPRDLNSELILTGVIRSAVLQQAISVGTTAVALPSSALSRRVTLSITNNSSETVYIGSSAVTTANGLPRYPRVTLAFLIEEEQTLYAIAGAAGCDVRIMEGA